MEQLELEQMYQKWQIQRQEMIVLANDLIRMGEKMLEFASGIKRQKKKLTPANVNAFDYYNIELLEEYIKTHFDIEPENYNMFCCTSEIVRKAKEAGIKLYDKPGPARAQISIVLSSLGLQRAYRTDGRGWLGISPKN